MENNKRRFVSKKLLMFLAVGSFLAAVFEGILYYRYSNVFFNALLILQNGISAFMFKPSISLSDAMQFTEKELCKAVILKSLFRITLAFESFFTSTTIRMP